MSRAVLANAFDTLGLPVSVRRSRVRSFSGDPDPARREAAGRLLDPYSRTCEALHSERSGLPVHGVTAELRRAMEVARTAEEMLSLHRAWSEIASLPKTRSALTAIAPSLVSWRRKKLAVAAIRTAPGRILEAHAVSGRAALAGGDRDRAIAHATVLVRSPWIAGGKEREGLALMFGAMLDEIRGICGRLDALVDSELQAGRSDDQLAGRLRACVAAAQQEVQAVVRRMTDCSEPAGALGKDQFARSLRDCAFRIGAGGARAALAGNFLAAAAASAGSEELRTQLARQAGDVEWALRIDSALSPCRTGRVQKAWSALRRLRRDAGTPARKAWLKEIFASYEHWLAPVPGWARRIGVPGFRVGWFGRRPLLPGSDFSSSWGFNLLGVPVLTGCVLLRRPDAPGDPYRTPVPVARLPLAFAPPAWGAMARAAAGLVLVVLASALVLDVGVANSREHASLTAAWKSLESGDIDQVDTALNRTASCRSPLIRWRRNRLGPVYLRRESEQLTAPEDLVDVLRRLAWADGDERTNFYQVGTPPPPEGVSRWLEGEPEEALIRALRTLPLRPLPPYGGRRGSESAEPWDVDAARHAELVEWLLIRSLRPESWKQQVALELARERATPHLWALALKLGAAPIAEIRDQLLDVLGRADYDAWVEHYQALHPHLDPGIAESLLDRHARGQWIGWDFVAGRRSVAPVSPQPLADLMANLGPSPNRERMSHAREATLKAGLRYREAVRSFPQGYSSWEDLLKLRAWVAGALEVLDEVPEPCWLATLTGTALNVLGRYEETIALCRQRRFEGSASIEAKALNALGRHDEALACLERQVAHTLPGLSRIQDQWASAAAPAGEFAREDRRNGELSEAQQKRILEWNGGRRPPSLEQWYRETGYYRTREIYQLRWVEAFGDQMDLAELIRGHLSASLSSSPLAHHHRIRAEGLAHVVLGWFLRGGDDQLRISAEAVLRVQGARTPEACFSRIAGTDDLEVLLYFARVFSSAGHDDLGLAAYESAWWAADTTERAAIPLLALALVDTPEARVRWLERGPEFKNYADRVALSVKTPLREGRWAESAEAARAMRDELSLQSNPEFESGRAVWSLLAWLADGNPEDLEISAGIFRRQVGAGQVRSKETLRLALRSLVCALESAISPDAAPAHLVHGSLAMDRMAFRPPGTSFRTLAHRATDDENLQAVLDCARRLLELCPGDREALEVLRAIAVLTLNEDLIPSQEQAARTGSAENVESLLPFPQLAQEGSPAGNSMDEVMTVMQSASRDPETRRHPEAYACVLHRLAVRSRASDAAWSRDEIESSLGLVREAERLASNPLVRDSLLQLSVGWHLYGERPKFADGPARPLLDASPMLALAIRGSVLSGPAIPEGEISREIARLALLNLDDDRRALSLTSFAALRLLRHGRAAQAEERLRGERVMLAIHGSARGSTADVPRFALEHWLVLDVTEGRDAAMAFGRESGWREGFEVLTRP